MKTIFIAIIAVTLAGCNMAHQQTGAIGGAVVGGLLGNTVGTQSVYKVLRAGNSMLGVHGD